MSINVVCPHCESRFNLQSDLLGKAMRCPVCHEIFAVQEAVAPVAIPAVVEEPVPASSKPAASRADSAAPKYRSGSITDFLQVLPTEAAPAPIPTDAPLKEEEVVFSDFEIVEDEKPAKTLPEPPKPAPAKEEPPTDEPAVVLEAVEPPKEVVWSANVAPPPPPPGDVEESTEDHEATAEEREEEPRPEP